MRNHLPQRAREKEGEKERPVHFSPPFIQQDGRNSAVVDRRDTLSLVTLLLLLAARFTRGTRLARPARGRNYMEIIFVFIISDAPILCAAAVIDRLFGDTRAAARARSSSFLLVAFVRESLFRNTGHFKRKCFINRTLYYKFAPEVGFVQRFTHTPT